jgi:hypothetical protein
MLKSPRPDPALDPSVMASLCCVGTLTMALDHGELGPFFYRFSRPGELSLRDPTARPR